MVLSQAITQDKTLVSAMCEYRIRKCEIGPHVALSMNPLSVKEVIKCPLAGQRAKGKQVRVNWFLYRQLVVKEYR